MLSCREVTELVTAYVERKLSLVDRARFTMHIAMCKHCRLYVKQLKLTIAALGALPKPVEPPPPEVREALLRQFESWKSRL